MPLIEGIGDEVTQFVVVLVIVVIIALAWWSTGSRPDRFRTVLIMGDPRRGLHHSVALSLRRRGRIENNNNTPRTVLNQNIERTVVQTEGTEMFNNDHSRPITVSPQNNNNSETDDNANSADATLSETPTQSSLQNSNEATVKPREPNPQNCYVTPVNEPQTSSNCVNSEPTVRCTNVELASSEREMNRIVSDMDAVDFNTLRNRRLNFFNKNSDNAATVCPQTLCMNIVTPPSRGDERPGINMPRNLQKMIDQHPGENPKTEDEITKNDSTQNITSNVELEQSNSDASIPQQETNTSSFRDVHETSEMSEDDIIVKIKYLNDTMKIVKASIKETLKDFKWRNFANELSSTSVRLRLIFKGRVLTEDNLSLSECGFYSNCVIHALTHPARHQRQQPEEPSPELPSDAAGLAAPRVNRGGRQRVWDLENVLMSLVSIALTIVWFCRCEYSNLFSVSASVALFGLTIFYSIAVFGLYLSDTFQTNRPQQQQQQNPVQQ